jgi:hypothetical protein
VAPSSKGHDTGDGTRTWTRVKIGDTRAQEIADLACLETAVNQGEPIEALPIYVTVSCGRPTLLIGETRFTLATWQVLIRIELDNASIKYGSRRWVEVQRGSFQSQTMSKTALRTIREHAFALGLEARAKASVPAKASMPAVGIVGSLFAKLNWRRGNALTESDTATIKATPEIVLIGQFGESIAIGDPVYGDPHKEYGLLSHAYPKDVGEDSKPLFTVEPSDPNEPMRVTVMTAVPFDKLCLLSEDSIERISQYARDEIRWRGDRALEAHEKLRRQMLRDELVNRVSRNQRGAGLPIYDGEFAVMIEMFEIRPRLGGGDSGAKGR